MKKALIHDWLDKYGGAERVVTAISEIMRFDYYYAYVNKMKKEDLVKTYGDQPVHIEQSIIMRKFKSSFRYFMPFFPMVVSQFNNQTKKNRIDLVISSSWALSKSYRVGNEIHICYLQARNFKYVWEESDKYFRGPLKMFSFLKTLLQKFDLKASKNPDFLISNSYFVRDWVKKRYDRDSVVIYPPVEVEDFYISDEKEDYFITVGRLEPYKRFDIIIDAFTKNGKKLIVVGDGAEMKKLKKRAGNNVSFVGYRSKAEIRELLSRAKGFVFAGVEDFGIAIVEALASGIPVIAYSGGASKELIHADNGRLFDMQTAESLNGAVEDFAMVDGDFDPHVIRESAMRFSKERFQSEFRQFVDQVVLTKLTNS
ncbi:glycosyltransferase [Olivibacter sp. SDN3]|uniref:glycosyltransferase n=1 Tax=Olivibacter sp. SDN3 TaxID=2764720 RepID=UPI001650DCE9|nr:glycosyltransferase [Olivibacter sp. SDN3]QNL52049.1 glycosyltransferase [Olivibacter sp. SDN3]